MKVQFWSREFCKFLMETYDYDKVTGLVKRKHWNVKGPKTYASIGSINKQGILVLPVGFEGKQIMVRVSKLCYFLATGLQHREVQPKNGVKIDNSFDNLLPIGPVILDPTIYMAEVEKEKTHSLEEWGKKVDEAKAEGERLAQERREKYEDELKKRREERVVKNPLLAEKHAQKMKEFSRREKIRKQNEDFEKIYPNGYERPRDMRGEIHSDNINGQLKIERAMREEWFAEAWMEFGLWTDCREADIREFWKKCEDMVGPVTPEELQYKYFEKGCSDEESQRALMTLDKWEHDRWSIGTWFRWIKSGDLAEKNLWCMGRDYEWKGQPFHRSEVLPSHLLLKKEELLTALRISIASRERALERRESEHEADKELLKTLHPATIVSPAYESAMQAERESEET